MPELDALLLEKQANLPRIRALVRSLLKSGESVRGYYALIQSLGPSFRSQFGRWARRRGRKIEAQVTSDLELAFRTAGYGCKAYRSANQRCASQLYDVVLYIRGESPLFIECKAGGLIENQRGVRLQPGHRALKNLAQRTPLLRQIIEEVNPPYLFYFVGAECDYAVPLQEVLQGLQKGNRIQKFYRVESPADLVRAYEAEKQT